VGVLGVNHIAFRTRDPGELSQFYAELTGAERLEGEHDPLRLGGTLLVFFASDEMPSTGPDPDEIAFDVDADGFGQVLAGAERMGCLERPPVEHTSWSKGFLVRDPDGRRIEFVYDDHGVFWRELT
jgi:catechol 2,3-dioxygenase-like lactoylglutathione lyase family enzyme